MITEWLLENMTKTWSLSTSISPCWALFDSGMIYTLYIYIYRHWKVNTHLKCVNYWQFTHKKHHTSCSLSLIVESQQQKKAVQWKIPGAEKPIGELNGLSESSIFCNIMQGRHCRYQQRVLVRSNWQARVNSVCLTMRKLAEQMWAYGFMKTQTQALLPDLSAACCPVWKKKAPGVIECLSDG